MKALLKTSVALNAGLILAVVWMLHRGNVSAPDSPTTPPVSALPAVVSAPPSAAVETSSVPAKKFRWSQLESSDYRSYIANLRAVGCPKQTIRDIITADVDGLYSPRREQLIAQVPDGPPLVRAEAQQALDTKLKALDTEEAAVLASLLGSPQSPAQAPTADVAVAPARTQRDESQDAAVSVPLAFRQFDPAAVQLNEDEINDLAYLRQKFQEDVGGPNQNPDDPAYLKHWQTAQPENDQMLRAMLGSRIYDQIQGGSEIQPRP